MSILYKRGDAVKQIVPVIQGIVTEASIVEDEVQYLVTYMDAGGEQHTRWFKEPELGAA